jgi:hypothetical protein
VLPVATARGNSKGSGHIPLAGPSLNTYSARAPSEGAIDLNGDTCLQV